MISILKKFNHLFDPVQRKKLVILFFLMLFGAFLEVLGVSLMLPLMSAIMETDIIETNEMVGQICGFLGIQEHKSLVLICIGALIGVFVCKDIFLIFQYYVQARFVCNSRFKVQRRLLHAFIQRPYEYYLNAESGEIIRVMNTDIHQTFHLLTAILTFMTESIISLALIISVFIMEPKMMLMIGASVGVTVIVIYKVVKPILRREGLSFQQNTARTNKWMLQAISGIKEVKVAHKEEFFEKNYNESGEKVVRAEQWNSVLNQTPRLLIEMVCVCSTLTFMALQIWMGQDIQTMIPSFGAFVMAAVKLLPSANRIVGAFNSIAYQEPSLNKTLENIEAVKSEEYLKTRAFEDTKEGTLTANDKICLKDISFCYPESQTKVLDNATMVIPVGKSVGIVGSSGAGKTTAVDIMLGLLKVQEGQILADGKNVMEQYPKWLSMIGYIPQSIFMLDDTIRANIAFGVSPEELNEDQVWHVLEEAQLADFVRGLPDGLDTTIGERGVRLSGGQRQRIGIARALYPDPDLLIFDEATSALDNETEAAIMESINSLHGKKTMVIIAHRLQTIENCDIVYRVQCGKIEREK